MYHFGVTVTLTSDLVYRIIVSGAYLVYYFREESQIWCMDAFLDADMTHIIFRSSILFDVGVLNLVC